MTDGSEVGAVRPIAVGEIWRRLVSKVAARAVKRKVMEKLQNQMGVGIPNGAEAIVHAVNRIYEALKNKENYGMLKIDYKNAFNSVGRVAFM